MGVLLPIENKRKGYAFALGFAARVSRTRFFRPLGPLSLESLQPPLQEVVRQGDVPNADLDRPLVDLDDPVKDCDLVAVGVHEKVLPGLLDPPASDEDPSERAGPLTIDVCVRHCHIDSLVRLLWAAPYPLKRKGQSLPKQDALSSAVRASGAHAAVGQPVGRDLVRALDPTIPFRLGLIRDAPARLAADSALPDGDALGVSPATTELADILSGDDRQGAVRAPPLVPCQHLISFLKVLANPH